MKSKDRIKEFCLDRIEAVKQMQKEAEFFCAETAKNCDQIVTLSRDS